MQRIQDVQSTWLKLQVFWRDSSANRKWQLLVYDAVIRMAQSLATKAGCPFERAFLLFLPVLATSCSSARLFINEFFLVPPLLWIGLCLDSGANKSGILSAIADVITGFEKHLFEEAEKSIRQGQADAESEDDEALGAADEARAPDQRDLERAVKRRKLALDKKLTSLCTNQPQIFCDEGSLPAMRDRSRQLACRCSKTGIEL